MDFFIYLALAFFFFFLNLVTPYATPPATSHSMPRGTSSSAPSPTGSPPPSPPGGSEGCAQSGVLINDAIRISPVIASILSFMAFWFYYLTMTFSVCTLLLLLILTMYMPAVASGISVKCPLVCMFSILRPCRSYTAIWALLPYVLT